MNILNDIACKLNWIPIEENDMQIGGKGFENLLMNMVLEKKT